MDKTDFIKFMKEYQSLDKDIDNVHDALRKLDPDFGGFCISRVNTIVMNVLQLAMNDKHDWIPYFVYDLEWGTKWKKGTITSKDSKDIKLKTLNDLYKLITEDKY